MATFSPLRMVAQTIEFVMPSQGDFSITMFPSLGYFSTTMFPSIGYFSHTLNKTIDHGAVGRGPRRLTRRRRTDAGDETTCPERETSKHWHLWWWTGGPYFALLNGTTENIPGYCAPRLSQPCWEKYNRRVLWEDRGRDHYA